MPLETDSPNNPLYTDRVEGTLCAVCGVELSQCLYEERLAVGPHPASFKQKLGIDQGEQGRPLQAEVLVQVPCCGNCFDQIGNEALRRGTLGGGGYDFRPVYRCNNAFHKTGEGAVPLGPVGSAPNGASWEAWGCPDPRCGTFTQDDESIEGCHAGSALFKSLVEKFSGVDS